MARAVIAALIALVLGACESMSAYEKAWQTMHLVDVAQTLNGPASDPCYLERGWDTEMLIGDRPHRDAVIAWGVGTAVAHYFLGRWLDHSKLSDGIKTAVRSIDLGYKGAVIGANHAEGIRPWGSNEPCAPSRITRPDAQPVM